MDKTDYSMCVRGTLTLQGRPGVRGAALCLPGIGKVKPAGGDVLDAGGNHAEDTGIAGFWRRQSTNET